MIDADADGASIRPLAAPRGFSGGEELRWAPVKRHRAPLRSSLPITTRLRGLVSCSESTAAQVLANSGDVQGVDGAAYTDILTAASRRLQSQHHHQTHHLISAAAPHEPEAANLSRTDRARAAALCTHVHGAWCKRYHYQQPVPFKPVPRGSRSCPNNCSSAGNCHHDTGACECPAGGALSRAPAAPALEAC